MEKVGDNGFITNQMLVPRFFSSLFFRLIWFLLYLNVWFFTFAVKVLSHEIKDCVDAFMGVMLAKAREDWSILAKNTLEH